LLHATKLGYNLAAIKKYKKIADELAAPLSSGRGVGCPQEHE